MIVKQFSDMYTYNQRKKYGDGHKDWPRGLTDGKDVHADIPKMVTSKPPSAKERGADKTAWNKRIPTRDNLSKRIIDRMLREHNTYMRKFYPKQITKKTQTGKSRSRRTLKKSRASPYYSSSRKCGKCGKFGHYRTTCSK